jgi:predicted RNA binding protein YcfA (HicA-like mRNA interferase family)
VAVDIAPVGKMKLPRDVSGVDLAKRLGRLGYEVTRQTGSHLRLTTRERGQHHVTIPNHDPLRVGTLAGILGDVAGHCGEGALVKTFLRVGQVPTAKKCVSPSGKCSRWRVRSPDKMRLTQPPLQR